MVMCASVQDRASATQALRIKDRVGCPAMDTNGIGA